MAFRPAWTIVENKIMCKEFCFEWNGGFAISQKKKNIANLHLAIKEMTNETALEVSSKGTVQLGREIGAFSLKYNDSPLENVFQSSKKYELGGPYLDLLDVEPKESKRDNRHKTSGKLMGFVFDEDIWSLQPKTAFYDYLYFNALIQNYGINLDLNKYDWFTDIEFNPNKSINCQARSVAVYKLIQKMNMFDSIKSKNTWLDFHKNHVCD